MSVDCLSFLPDGRPHGQEPSLIHLLAPNPRARMQQASVTLAQTESSPGGSYTRPPAPRGLCKEHTWWTSRRSWWSQELDEQQKKLAKLPLTQKRQGWRAWTLHDLTGISQLSCNGGRLVQHTFRPHHGQKGEPSWQWAAALSACCGCGGGGGAAVQAGSLEMGGGRVKGRHLLSDWLLGSEAHPPAWV